MVVATHPHADQFGGLQMILRQFTVYLVADSGWKHTSALWSSYR